MDIRSQSSLLAAIVGLALGVSMLLRDQRARVHSRYALLAISIGAFNLVRFFEALWPWNEGQAFGVPRVVMGVALLLGSLIPSAALGFFLEFLSFSPRAARWGRPAVIASVTLGFAVAVSPLGDITNWRIAVGVVSLAAASVSVWLVIMRMRKSESSIDKARLAYLAVGGGLALIFVGIDLLARFGAPAPGALGPVVTTLYLFFLSQTLLRLRLMDLHELFGKAISQAALAVILALLFVLLTAWVGDNLGLYIFNTSVAALVMLILFEPLRMKVDERVVAAFFRERSDFLAAVGTILDRTAGVIDIGQLATVVLDGLNETRRVTHTSIYLLAEDRPGFRLFDARGPQPALFIDLGTARGLLGRSEKAQLLETVERRIAELRRTPHEGKRPRDEIKRLTDVKNAMQQMKAGITAPLVGNDRVIGFLNLWDERMPEAFASDEIALILELGERVATVVENSKLYERMRERDRLAALGEMAAGLAHEIRNPLGAIKGAAQCLDPKQLPKDDAEFIEVIVEEVNRLNGVVTEFLDYARPLKQNFGPTDVSEVVTRTVRLIQNGVPANVTLKTELHDALPRVDGDAEQLKQVLLNLVQNAVQALSDKPGVITIRTRPMERFNEFRSADSVEILVTDDGPGIPADQQLNIFVPFFTTKQKGTGLGLAICQRIVKNHGGSISVQSKPGDGTTFMIRLPTLPVEPERSTPAPDGTPSPDAPREDTGTGTEPKVPVAVALPDTAR